VRKITIKPWIAYQGHHPPSQLAAMAATTHSATELE
jgi:hypothetical protein